VHARARALVARACANALRACAERRERPFALSALPKGSSHPGNSEREAARPGAGATRRRCGPAPVGPRIQARKEARPGAGARRGRRPGPAPLLASHSGQPVAGEGTQGSGRPPCPARWPLAPRLNVRRVRLARPGCPFPSRHSRRAHACPCLCLLWTMRPAGIVAGRRPTAHSDDRARWLRARVSCVWLPRQG
jgi:hypothetical protein